VPNFQDAYFEQLDMEQWGLVPVAQVDSYKGLIFGNFDSQAPTLIEYLGNMAWYLDLVVDRLPGGSEVLGGTHKWIMPCNWKFPSDNFIGDGYHVLWSHLTALRPELSMATGPGARQVYAGNGHGLSINTGLLDSFDSTIYQYEREIRADVIKHLGERRAEHQYINATVFPNFSMLTYERTIRVWHPRGPGKVETWSWAFVDKDAPQHVKDAYRLQVDWSFSPSGMFEQDDMENWQFCTATGLGVMTRKIPMHLGMGKGHEGPDEEFPGRVAGGIGENSQRGFYERWAEVMAAESWNDIRIDRVEAMPRGP